METNIAGGGGGDFVNIVSDVMIKYWNYSTSMIYFIWVHMCLQVPMYLHNMFAYSHVCVRMCMCECICYVYVCI